MPKRETIFAVMALAVTLGLVAAALLNRDSLVDVERIVAYSLAGVFITALAANSLVSLTLIPIPYYLAVILLANTLSLEWGMMAPVMVGVTSALGATLGQTPTFAIGYGGKDISRRIISRFDGRRYQQALELVGRRGPLTAFLISAIMNPIHLPVTMALGTLKFPPVKWISLTLAGNMVKNLGLAFIGYYTVDFFLLS